ncbi:MAG: VOC family protein, partial [Chloroflexi bacterium]|nr:VOC family protein [Chloroflexota bacterium]
MITGMNHVAVVVRNLDEALKMYQTNFGLKASKVETLPEQGVRAALLPLAHGGEIELLEPIDPNGGVARFL